MGMGQGSALSPILSALYLAPILWQASLEAPEAALISYIDDGTIIVQSKMWDTNLIKLQSTYSVMFELTQALGLVLEHDKSEVFHFSRKSGDANPPVDLGYALFTGDSPLCPNTYWRYLGFFFDRSLSFQEHSRWYSTKALTTVKAMVSLGNSVCRLSPKNKRLLYHVCILPVATYGAKLWYYEGSCFKGPMKVLRTMQARTCHWITGAFHTSPLGAVETLVGIPPIHLHICKLVERSQEPLCTAADME